MKYFSQIRISLAVILWMASVLSCMAYDFSAVCSTGQTLYYKITNSDLHYVEITFPGNSGTYWEGYTKPSGRIVLPRSVRYNSIDYSVTRVGDLAFYQCSELTSVTIPNSITIIAHGAFCDCRGLSGSLSIPNFVTSIGQSAFSNCSNLTGSLSIPNSVTFIGGYAFENCSKLSSVTIPNSVTRIEMNPFLGCSGLTSIRVADDNEKYDSRGNSNAIIETETNILISGIKTTVIPNTVTEIGYFAFAHITSLTSIAIPSSVTRIGRSAFYDTKIYNTTGNWDQNVLYIDGCLIATKEYVPANYTIKPATRVIADYAFYNRTRLTSITIPNSVISIGGWAFFCCGLRGRLNIPNSVTSIGIQAFSGCTGLTSVTIPNSMTSIELAAFEGCAGLTSVNIPNSVTKIEKNPFYNCTGLTSIVVASDNPIYDSRDNSNAIIETATNTMISGCKTTIIPNSVAIIGERAFAGCSGLTSVEIPNSVTQINWYAFYGCTSLTTVTVKRITPPNVDSPKFPYQNCTLIVPCNYGYAYRNHYSWSQFSFIEEEDFPFEVFAISSDESVGRVSVVQHPNCENNTAVVKAESIGNYSFKHWMRNGEVVSTDNPYSFTVDDNIEVVAYFSGLGVEEETAQKVSISPNPANDRVKVNCEEMQIISMFSQAGRRVKTINAMGANEMDLDLSGMAKGLYMLRIETQNGTTINRKIIVQ